MLFVHSLPEGFALGTAWASTVDGLAAFIVIAIAVQNIPEVASVAIPMEAAGYSAWRQFWAAVGTSAPQPVGGDCYLAVDQIDSLLPLSFAFAAGAMLALVVVELLPDVLRGDRTTGAIVGALAGGAAMLALSVVLASRSEEQRHGTSRPPRPQKAMIATAAIKAWSTRSPMN